MRRIVSTTLWLAGALIVTSCGSVSDLLLDSDSLETDFTSDSETDTQTDTVTDTDICSAPWPAQKHPPPMHTIAPGYRHVAAGKDCSDGSGC